MKGGLDVPQLLTSSLPVAKTATKRHLFNDLASCLQTKPLAGGLVVAATDSVAVVVVVAAAAPWAPLADLADPVGHPARASWSRRFGRTRCRCG